MKQPIKHKVASKINECIKTNSIPFQLFCEDGELYYAKTTFAQKPPYSEMINEILCNYLLDSWGVNTTIPVLIKIPQEVYDQFVEEGNFVDKRYDSVDFNSQIFFGVEKIQATELDLYNSLLKNRHDYNKYANPTDLLKIGVFDKWIANNDRRAENPNILLKDDGNGFEFVAIDHTEGFGYQANYKNLKIALMETPRPNSILSSAMSKSILTFAGSKFVTNFDKDILKCINDGIKDLDGIFEQIPSEYGLSKQGKAKIKEILSNKDRNIVISKLYLNYVK